MMTSKTHHKGPGRSISAVRTRAASLTIGSAIALIFVASASVQAQTYQVIHNFSASVDGAQPNGVTRDSAGNFYGTTNQGGSFLGTVFKVDAATHAVTVLHTFTGTPDGGLPSAGVTLDPSGNVFGTTSDYGAYGRGAVFKIDSAGVETILHSFHKLDGDQPNADLTRDATGNLYGTTSFGGTSDNGVVFRIDSSGAEKTLYKFAGPDGSRPYGGLARDSAGNLYGTTAVGGAFGHGTVFELAPDGTETVLHSFAGGADGDFPAGKPVLDSAGNLYGATALGGTSNKGTVFKVDSSGVHTVVHSFNGADGSQPWGVILDGTGNLYGNAFSGGTSNLGVLFKVDPSGTETVLHSFTGTDGKNPSGTLLLRSDGTLFGSTQGGGINQAGTLFRMKP